MSEEVVAKKSRSEKSKPLEFSCRRPVPVPKPQRQGLVKRAVEAPVDPRFNREIAGDFDAGRFGKAYAFLDEYREAEKKEVMTKLKKSKKLSEDDRAVLEMSLTKMASQDAARKRVTLENEVRQELKRGELEAVAKTGKKVYYHPRSAVLKLVQERQEAEMKKTGQYAKFKAQKEKRRAGQEKKNSMPHTRRVVEVDH